MTGLLSHLAWRNPDWLWFALSPWVVWLAHALSRLRGRVAYAEPHLLAWASGQSAAGNPRWPEAQGMRRRIAIALAWLLFAMALAGPRVPLRVYRPDRAHDTQLLVVLDLSRSMTARDVAPSRLQSAKLALEDLIRRVRRLKIGLVVYAGRPHLLLPPTDDKGVLRHALHLLHYGLMPSAGSDLPAALDFAARQFSAADVAHAVLVVSDGGLPADTAIMDKRLDAAATGLAQQGIRIYALGVGTQDGAALPGRDGGWLHYRGRPVVTRLHPRRLQRLARIGHGIYAPVSDNDADWQSLYDNGIRDLQRGSTEKGATGLTEWRELYAWCLLPALLLLVLAQTEPRATHKRPARSAVLLLSMLAFSLHPVAARAGDGPAQRQAYQAYASHDWAAAQRAYAQIPGFAGRVGEGASAYHRGRYADAARLFTQAVLDADTDRQRARAVFNLADTRYRMGAYTEAAALYRETLRYAPDNQAARSNLALTLDILRQPHTSGAETGRPGPGALSAHVPAGSTVTGRPSLGKRDRNRSTRLARSQADIVDRDLLDARPLVQRMVEFRHPDWHYAATSPARIALQANALAVDQGLLWKRLFIEQEDMPPAPLAKPVHLHGVLPW